MILPEIKEWHVETLRLTLFGNGPVQPAGRNWWASVTGTLPEATLNRANVGEYTESGEFLEGQLELRVAINRVDMILRFPFSDMPGAPKPDALERLLPTWLEGMGKWLAKVDFPVVRLASGIVVIKKVDGASEGNKFINEFLPFMNIGEPDKLSDLMVQVNLPKSFDCASGMRHNRICKIGVLNRQTITIGAAGFPTTINDTVIRGELDMSTAIENVQSLSLEVLPPIVQEMTGSFLNILTKGMVDE